MHNIDPEIRISGTRGQLIWRYCGAHSLITEKGTETFVSPSPIETRKRMFETVVDRIDGLAARNCSTELAKGVCRWVNALHDTCPIEDIPERYRVKVSSEGGEVFDTIDNLEFYALEAQNGGISLKEAGAPWAIEPLTRDLGDYRSFEGGFCDSIEGQGRIIGLSS